ncbi:MAG: hypothetical protein WBP58_17730 [Chitinophagaceae bacterium]
MLVTASIYDPVSKDEGTIDPLGLASIGERLSSKLLPGIRQRMRHPRLLTAAAASSLLCKHYTDRVAKDGKTEAFLVFEWYVVQALFKMYSGADELLGLPGIRKVKEAWLRKDPLSMNRYLKNAYTFGFHGVYRTLAEELDIAKDNELGEKGADLLRIWEEEQNYPGFISNQQGRGRELFKKLQKAVEDGLDGGEVAYGWNWKVFDEIAPLFAPKQGGPKEKDFLYKLLINDVKGFRQEMIAAVPDFQQSLQEDELRTERRYHEFMLARASANLCELLQAIKAYEVFARSIHNPFYKILQYLSRITHKVSVKELKEQLSLNFDLSVFRTQFQETTRLLGSFNEGHAFEETFKSFELLNNSDEFISTLISHHEKIQEHKPPNGKMSWLEEFPNGGFMIRPAYRERDTYLSENDYVNQYRLTSLINFHLDLKG